MAPSWLNPAPRAPSMCGTQAQSCLSRLSDGSCLFPLPICLTPVGAARLWGLSYGSPCSWGDPGAGGVCREVPREGEGFIWQMGTRLLSLHQLSELGFERFSFSICTRGENRAAGEAAGRRSQAGEAFPLAVGVSRPGFDCENNSWAGQCSCILLLPYSLCLLSFVRVSSCSDLPLSALLDAALQSECFCASCSLPGRLIKRRKDVFQKYLAFSSDI